MVVIGLCGDKGCGKDSLAEVLGSIGFIRVAFADALYREAAEAFNVTVDFLGNRDTKETPLPELALVDCTDPQFVATMLQILSDAGSVPEGTDLMTVPLSPRSVLQVWGTEYRRKAQGKESYWLDNVQNEIKRLSGLGHSRFVITDVRFINEAKVIESLGGEVWRIIRPVLAESMRILRNAGQATALHVSEQEMQEYSVSCELINQENAQDIFFEAGVQAAYDLLRRR